MFCFQLISVFVKNTKGLKCHTDAASRRVPSQFISISHVDTANYTGGVVMQNKYQDVDNSSSGC